MTPLSLKEIHFSSTEGQLETYLLWGNLFQDTFLQLQKDLNIFYTERKLPQGAEQHYKFLHRFVYKWLQENYLSDAFYQAMYRLDINEPDLQKGLNHFKDEPVEMITAHVILVRAMQKVMNRYHAKGFA